MQFIANFWWIWLIGTLIGLFGFLYFPYLVYRNTMGLMGGGRKDWDTADLETSLPSPKFRFFYMALSVIVANVFGVLLLIAVVIHLIDYTKS